MLNITLEDIERSGIIPETGLSTLRAMVQGDRNNKKGEAYERFFAFWKVLSLTQGVFTQRGSRKLSYLAHIQLTNTQDAFVDDLCIIHNGENPSKENYQLKNSPTTGKITPELIEKFYYQDLVDKEILKLNSYSSTLVCSDKRSVARNKTAYHHINSIYYPYCATAQAAIDEPESGVAHLLGYFCRTPSNYISAIKIIMSALYDGAEIRNVRLDGVWQDARAMAKPDIFYIESAVLPKWFVEKCEQMGCLFKKNEMGEYSAIQYLGFYFFITHEFVTRLNALDKDKIYHIEKNEELVNLLMDLNKVAPAATGVQK